MRFKAIFILTHVIRNRRYLIVPGEVHHFLHESHLHGIFVVLNRFVFEAFEQRHENYLGKLLYCSVIGLIY